MIQIKTSIDKIKKFADRQLATSEKIIKATVSDLKTRAPGWIAQEVVKDYNVRKSDFSPKVKSGKRRLGSIKVKGSTITGIEITYTGQRLSPDKFKMKPRQRPKGRRTAAGKYIRPKSYRVSYEVLRGKRTTLDEPKVFIGPTKGKETTVRRRKTSARYPIEKVVTIALPQMVHNDRNAKAIEARLNAGAEERLRHNMERFGK